MDKINKTVKKPMSDADIKKYMPAYVYDNFFSNNKNISHLPAIILYELVPGFGHWTMIHETVSDNGEPCIEFFCSYGSLPDKNLKIFNKKYDPKLSKWLVNTNKDIAYNQYKIQSDDMSVMTCGHHCIVRNMFKKYSIEDYYRALKKASEDTNLSYDQIVSIIVP